MIWTKRSWIVMQRREVLRMHKRSKKKENNNLKKTTPSVQVKNFNVYVIFVAEKNK